jgi:hypothetical protein
MARSFVTVRELIYWEYAKLISGSAVGGKNYRFINYTYRKLLAGQVVPSSILRENKQLFVVADTCAYCGSSGPLQWEHVVPRSRGGPDTIDNMVRACAPCNLAKGARDPYQWYSAEQPDIPIPRLVMGKFLKLLFDEYARHDLLDSEDYLRLHAIDRRVLGDIFQSNLKI